MKRLLLLFLGILAITCFEFFYYPGHTYLAGDSQNLVAMMERLRTPGFLSRDLVATNPNLTYTIYDEVTLFLSRVSGHDFQWVLAAQQLTFRFAGVLGVVLLSIAARMEQVPALGVAALINAGAFLPGLQLHLIDPEPTPFAFSLALTILAFGLLAHSKPLLAGLVGGVALVYQPVIAAVFWCSVLCGFFSQRRLRPLLRATFPTLLVFSLLLANAAQLQPGNGEAPPFLHKISDSWMRLQTTRTPELWMSTWGAGPILLYTLITAGGCFALRRLWPNLTSLVRCVLLAPLLIGLASVFLSVIGFQILKWAIVGELQITRTLSLVFVFGLIACSAAGSRSWRQEQRYAASLWFAPVLIGATLLRSHLPSMSQREESQSIRAIAKWAEMNTWGGSMFLFPDAGKSRAPGEFRGCAVRAIYTDWNSRGLIKIFPASGAEWDRRWREAGGENYSTSRLPGLLSLPVEYVVLRRDHTLQGVKAELFTPDFVVYDTHRLQTAAHPLRTVSGS